MHREMLTYTEASPDPGGTTYSAFSSHTAAYRFTERDPCAATDSAVSPYTAANAYRFAASYSGTAPVA
jgi:hypothetical protein